MVPVRCDVPELSWQVTVTVPLLLPVPGVTDNQLKDSVTAQEVLEATEKDLFSPAAIKLNEAGETLKDREVPT